RGSPRRGPGDDGGRAGGGVPVRRGTRRQGDLTLAARREDDMHDERSFLRHTLATHAYRGGKATRGAQPDFAEFKVSPGTRTPIAILCHIGDLLEWALTIARGEPGYAERTPQSWEAEVQR